MKFKISILLLIINRIVYNNNYNNLNLIKINNKRLIKEYKIYNPVKTKLNKIINNNFNKYKINWNRKYHKYFILVRIYWIIDWYNLSKWI